MEAPSSGAAIGPPIGVPFARSLSGLLLKSGKRKVSQSPAKATFSLYKTQRVF